MKAIWANSEAANELKLNFLTSLLESQKCIIFFFNTDLFFPHLQTELMGLKKLLFYSGLHAVDAV